MASVISPPPSGSDTTRTRAQIGRRTLRVDRWWLMPLVTFVVFSGFIAYSTWRAFQNDYYYAKPLLSPLYSPCLTSTCPPGSSDLGVWFGDWWPVWLSPALVILIFPLGFRLTCYYYRKAYYRAFWQSPPACAVAEPHTRYTGETRFPLIFQNSHRWFFFVVLAFNILLTWDAIHAFRDSQGEWGAMSVGTLVLVVNAAALWLYSASCHSCRHAIGGRLKHFSKHPVRYKLWTWVSELNHHHPKFAWISLVSVAFADFYVFLVATGAIENFYFFGN